MEISFSNFLFVGIGGSIGAICRFYLGVISNHIFQFEFPFTTLIINIQYSKASLKSLISETVRNRINNLIQPYNNTNINGMSLRSTTLNILIGNDLVEINNIDFSSKNVSQNLDNRMKCLINNICTSYYDR
mgnify:CR=1 FL=1